MRDCTCVGSCRGAEGLGAGWNCVVDNGSVEDARVGSPSAGSERPRGRCEGRYPVPQTSPPRDEPFDVTYRCALDKGHAGPHGAESTSVYPPAEPARPRDRMTFTPGPWRTRVPTIPITTLAADDRIVLARAFDGSEKAIVDRVRGGTPEQANANALLIAAAPMMYQELEQAADTFRDFANVLNVIGKDVMAAAASIAERHIRESLAAIGGPS